MPHFHPSLLARKHLPLWTAFLLAAGFAGCGDDQTGPVPAAPALLGASSGSGQGPRALLVVAAGPRNVSDGALEQALTAARTG